MILSPTRLKQTLRQFEANVIPDNHPAMARLKQLFGEHTYFLAPNGLNIVEPFAPGDAGIRAGTVINLASWTDGSATSLQAHEPEPTEMVIEFVGDGDETGEEPDLMD